MTAKLYWSSDTIFDKGFGEVCACYCHRYDMENVMFFDGCGPCCEFVNRPYLNDDNSFDRDDYSKLCLEKINRKTKKRKYKRIE